MTAAIPKTLDLGALGGPVLVFGGPYGNLQATEAILAEARRRGIPPARVVCTGDVVAYCADPAATVAAIRDSGVHVLMGNCEESLGAGRSDCGCGFAEGSECDLLSQRWFAHANAHLDDDAKDWMAGLPRRIVFTLAGRRFAVLHGAATDVSKFVFGSTPWADKAVEFARLRSEGIVADAIVAGHAGLPFADDVEGRLWLNAGAIGMPANDGTPRTWYAILTPRADGLAIAIQSLSYDHAGAIRRMAEERVSDAYARSLNDGLWPNIDVLPYAERAMRGCPLAPYARRWPEPAEAFVEKRLSA